MELTPLAPKDQSCWGPNCLLSLLVTQEHGVVFLNQVFHSRGTGEVKNGPISTSAGFWAALRRNRV